MAERLKREPVRTGWPARRRASTAARHRKPMLPASGTPILVSPSPPSCPPLIRASGNGGQEWLTYPASKRRSAYPLSIETLNEPHFPIAASYVISVSR
jgi:hypothetical protein